MIPSLLRGLRLALILSTATIGAVWPIHERVAYADDDEEEEEDDGGDEEEEGEEEDSSQPPITAGGLFTLKTYPVNELLRPLTMTRGITQIRAGIGTDVSDKQAFESVGLSLEAEYGLQDHFTLRGGLTSAYNFNQFAVYGGFEGALAYDFIDVRIEGVLRRPAVQAADNTEYTAGDIKGGIDLGFPFRYAAKPEIAIVALDTLMSIDFDSKPDLTPSLGIATNPIPAVSVVVFAKLVIIDFDTKGENLKVPATARIQFSPSQKLDLGAEFTFLNLKVPEGSTKKFYDDRFLTLYAAFRM